MFRYLAERSSGMLLPSSFQQSVSADRVLSLKLSKQLDIQKVHRGPINSLDLDLVEMRYLISGASDGVISIYDLHNTTGQPQFTCPVVSAVEKSSKHAHRYSVETVQWYPADSGLFVSSSFDKMLKVWDTNNLVPVETISCQGRVYCHHMSQIATKHCLIAVATSSSPISLVDLKSGSHSHILRSHKDAVLTVCWSPRDEYVLASGSKDNKALLWDIRMARNCLFMLDQHNGDKSKSGPKAVQTAHNGAVNAMKFTPDGLHIATFGTDCRMRLWNTHTGKNMLVNFGRINNEQQKCLNMEISWFLNPEMVFIPHDSNIDVFCLRTGAKLLRLVGHYNDCNTMVYHPYYNELYSGGNDRNIIVWSPKMFDIDPYEEHLKNTGHKSKLKETVVNVMKDTWSSDED